MLNLILFIRFNDEHYMDSIVETVGQNSGTYTYEMYEEMLKEFEKLEFNLRELKYHGVFNTEAITEIYIELQHDKTELDDGEVEVLEQFSLTW